MTLYDQQERDRASFTESDAFDIGPVLLLQDEKGNVKTRLKSGEVMALDSVTTSLVRVDDGEGFAASLGVTNMVTPSTGETHKTSAASLILFDKNKKVIWKAP